MITNSSNRKPKLLCNHLYCNGRLFTHEPNYSPYIFCVSFCVSFYVSFCVSFYVSFCVSFCISIPFSIHIYSEIAIKINQLRLR